MQRDNKHDPGNHAPTEKSLMAAHALRAPQAVLFARGFNSVRYADGGKPAAADVSPRALCAIGQKASRKANSIPSRSP